MAAMLDGRALIGEEGGRDGSSPGNAPVPLTSSIDSIIPLSQLRSSGERELVDIIDALRGQKCLVVQSELGGLLNQIVVEGSKTLKDIGVQYFRELKGELGDFSAAGGARSMPDNVIYLVRPSLPMMKTVAHQIHTSMKAGLRSQYHIYFVPYRTVACEQMLEDEGVLELCEIGEFNLGMVPFECDMLSLELEDVFRQCYVDGDTSSLSVIANALHGLQLLYGVIPNVKGKGAASKKILQTLCHLRCESGAALQSDRMDACGVEAWWQNNTSAVASANGEVDGGPGGRGAIDTLVLLDREVDMVSPLITPLTYEGLLDELIGIDNGKVKLDASLMGDIKDINVKELTGGRVTSLDGAEGAGAGAGGGPSHGGSLSSLGPDFGHSGSGGGGTGHNNEKMTLPMNNTDAVYANIRDLSIERLGGYLQEQAIKSKQRYATFRDNKDASISEIHDFVKNLPALTKEYKCLHQHINLAEFLKKTTDSSAFRDQWQGERGMLEGELYVDQIEDMICADVERCDLYKVLRLMCIQSLTAGGIRSNRYDALRRMVVQTYGYQHLFLITNLEKAGLLKRKDLMLVDTAPAWTTIRNQTQLIEDSGSPGGNRGRAGISYVSAGYAPLSVRIVQRIGETSTGWRSLSDVLRLLPGPMIDYTQLSNKPEELVDALKRSASDAAEGMISATAGGGGIGASSTNSSPRENSDGTENAVEKKVMLVMVVGGLTFTEIAAFRHLSKDPSFPYKIIVGATKICNGSTLLKSAASPAYSTPGSVA